jgi:transcriptional regulator with XRE-family HTH domain
MARNGETRRLVALLRRKINQTGLSQREIERRAGLGHGSIGNLLNGRTELGVRHLEVIGPVLRMPVADFFLEAYAARALAVDLEAYEAGLPATTSQDLLQSIDLELQEIEESAGRLLVRRRLFLAFRRYLIGQQARNAGSLMP